MPEGDSGAMPSEAPASVGATPHRPSGRLVDLSGSPVVIAAVGVAAVAVAWAVGALVATFNSSWTDPIISVGNRVVDGVPRPVKNAAISLFGTNDKKALIASTVLILFGLALWTARRVLRSGWRSSIPMVSILAVVGTLSSTLGREGSALGWVPTLASTAATLALFWATDWLVHQPRPASASSATSSGTPEGTQRRYLLTAAGLTTLAAVGLGALSGQRRDRSVRAARRLRLGIPSADSPLGPQEQDPLVSVELATPLYMPNDRFYRIDTALSVPVLDANTWNLKIDGMVDNQLSVTYQELIDRPLFEADVTIACVSNEVGGDLVGNARWLGCRLDDLLDEAGIQPTADQVVGWSIDGWSGGFPVEVLDGRNAMIAVAMNGELLPVEHGFPARLIIPGVYGYVSATKWLDRIELTRFEDFAGYWIPRGWSALAPIKVQSRIDRPRSGSSVSKGTYQIAGVAWAPIDGVSKVEVGVDGQWQAATLGPDIGRASWRQWWLDWDATPGEHLIEVRATNGKGERQTDRESRPDPDGATGYHQIQVNVDG